MLSGVICIGYSLQKNNMNSGIKKKKNFFFLKNLQENLEVSFFCIIFVIGKETNTLSNMEEKRYKVLNLDYPLSAVELENMREWELISVCAYCSHPSYPRFVYYFKRRQV